MHAKLENTMSKQWASDIFSFASGIEQSVLERAVETNDYNILSRLNDGVYTVTVEAGENIEAGFVDGATAAERALPRSLQDLIIIDPTQTRVLDKIRSQSAQYVTNVTQESRLALRATLEQAYKHRATPQSAAKYIKNNIGLNRPQNESMNRLWLDLMEQGYTESEIGSILAAEYERKLTYRAVTIARTEMTGAINNGRVTLWQEGVTQGHIPRDEFDQIWSTSSDERVRKSHQVMNGQRVAIGQPFITGDGVALVAPGVGDDPSEVVNCRCTVMLRMKSRQ